MYEVEPVVVHGGQIVLDHVPFQDGQAVRVLVIAAGETKKRSIAEVRQLLAGSVERFDDPFEPMIPVDDWEMLK